MAAPSVIDGLGDTSSVPRLNQSFDPGGANLTPEDYFVLTRVDGRTSLKELVLISGFPTEQAVAILKKLHDEGAILMPGESPPEPRPAPPRSPAVVPPPDAGPPLDEGAMAEAVDLTDEQKRMILVRQARLRNADLFSILDVDFAADRREIKRAYFKISKDFHPDRYYGKNLGSFRERLAEIFEKSSAAFHTLSDDKKRKAYLDRLRGQGSDGGAGQSRAEHAAQLFERACAEQAAGSAADALKYFAAALRVDPQPRYFIRAAEACLDAGELSQAEEYAKKAAELQPKEAQARRILARVYRAEDKVDQARGELEAALRLDPDNEHIASELDELKRA